MSIKTTARDILLVLAVPLVLSACQPSSPEVVDIVRPIKALQVGSAEILVGKSFPGVAKATQEVDLSFRVPGVLRKMPVKIGQEVRVGDVIASLDPRDFEVEEANAKAGLANAQAQLKNAKVEYNRVLRIQKEVQGVVSQSAIDLRETNYEQALATYASFQAQLNASQDRLSYATLKAPFDGVIVQRYVENFQDIGINMPVFRLVDISKIEMDINVPENLISNLPYVQNTRVTFDALPHVDIPAQIKEVSNEASQSTRTYRVRFIMTPPPGIDILPGMAGQVTGEVIKPGQEKQDVIIPVGAVFSSTDSLRTHVWIYDTQSQIVTKRTVQKGSITDGGLVITEGLKQGDWIATAGVHFLTDGQKVRLLDQEGTKQ
jgi:RND family efflux transporter MFP subunit